MPQGPQEEHSTDTKQAEIAGLLVEDDVEGNQQQHYVGEWRRAAQCFLLSLLECYLRPALARAGKVAVGLQ